MGTGAAAAAAEAPAAAKRTLVFTYGTLKRGFSNHALLQELSRAGDASFVGAAVTASRLPLVCGPYRVPFLLNLPGDEEAGAGGSRVAGELYAVTPRGLARLDELEGVSRGHYERLPVAVDLAAAAAAEEGEGEGGGGGARARVDAVAYYAHRDYAAALWRRSGGEGYPEYSHDVARGYVRRKDRPQGQTFLEQIRTFVSSQS
jgi:gamma-glutamylaminecyclotransferase